MTTYAERTGLATERPPQRYLWTDAFAVCNFLGLARATGDEHYRRLALKLVDQVHHVLGWHRSDDSRKGWISGLSDSEGEAHPTRGGLRIGKPLPERGPQEPYDEHLEWDRDGQYFHYLTKWMHALDQVARATGEPRYNLWARELAHTAERAFTYPAGRTGQPSRMVWKMGIDLSRPLVASMGQHDPLDGYITYLQLQATATEASESAAGPGLAEETAEFAVMLAGSQLSTPDPLGIGGLLVDAYRAAQLMDRDPEPGDRLLEHLLGAALSGLQYYTRSPELRMPSDSRLAFRELGLAIGLHAAARMRQEAEGFPRRAYASAAVRERLQALRQYATLAQQIEDFWRNPTNRRGGTWAEHRDINEVMVATSLRPEGFLVLRPAA